MPSVERGAQLEQSVSALRMKVYVILYVPYL